MGGKNFRLPDDYKEFVTRFGSGVLGEEFIIWNPFNRDTESALLPMAEQTVQAFGELAHETPQFYEHLRFYPEADGLFPFALTGMALYLM